MAHPFRNDWGTHFTNTTIMQDLVHGDEEANILPQSPSLRQMLPHGTPVSLTSPSSSVHDVKRAGIAAILLPQPSRILRSQSSELCKACGKIDCELLSHGYYSRSTSPTYLLADKRTSLGTLQSSDSEETSSRSLKPQFPIHEEQQKLLASWLRSGDHFERGSGRHLFSASWMEVVLHAARKHLPLFHALLATSASFEALANTNFSHVASHYMHIASRSLFEMSSNPGSSTDECILAHLCLILVLVTQGDTDELEERFAKIVHLVARRGGPPYLGLKGTVAELLFHADFLQAVSLKRLPIFKMILPPLKIGLPPRLGVAFRELTGSTVLSSDLLLAADSVCRCTDILELSPAAAAGASGAVNAFGYLATVSEYQLANCNSLFAGTQNWNELICLALLLFNSTILRAHGGIDASIRQFEARFWSVVRTIFSEPSFWEPPRHLVLWILTMGLTASIHQQSPFWKVAIEKLRAVRTAVSLDGWDDFRCQVLDQYLWVRRAQEEVFYKVWLEVERQHP